MPKLLTINVKNLGREVRGFYFFQQPVKFSDGSPVYSNSLYSQSLGSYDSTGSILTFQVDMQYFAAIQQANSRPQVGQVSGHLFASRAVDLAPATGAAGDWTTASVSPLGFMRPQAGAGVRAGAFRITTPAYPPSAFYYNVGSAVQVDGGVRLSSFVVANPDNDADFQPILKYYVQLGNPHAGAVINFQQSSVNAAVCDFSGGYSAINVTLNRDGTWSTQVVQ